MDQSSAATYFPQTNLLPDYMQQLVKALGSNAKTDAKQYNSFISNPTASPLFTNQLNGILTNPVMQNQRQQLQQQLGDEFRGAGNMSSGIYGNAAANQNTQFLQQDQTLASQLLGQMFPQMASALMQPQNLAAQLMSALKLQQQYGAPQTPQVYGGGGSGGSNDFLAQYQANGAGNPYDPFSGVSFGSGGASSGVNYNPSAQPAPTTPNIDYSQYGSTMFMPNGQYISSGNANGGLPAWQPNASADWQSLYGNADSISGEY